MQPREARKGPALFHPVCFRIRLILRNAGCTCCIRTEATHGLKGHAMTIPQNTSAYLWGAFLGAVALAIIGFSWGGWVTGGSATRSATAAAHDATVAALAPICAERFRSQPDAMVKTDALIKTSSWDRASGIEKSGFATMPGSKAADSDVARACAEILTTSPTPKS